MRHDQHMTYYKPVEPQNKNIGSTTKTSIYNNSKYPKQDSEERGESLGTARPCICCGELRLHKKIPTLFRRIWKNLASYMRRHSVMKTQHLTSNIHIHIHIHL